MRVLWIHQNLVTGRQAGNARSVRVAAALLEAGAALDIVASTRSYFGDPTAPGLEREGALTLHRLQIQTTSARPQAYLEFNRRAFRYALKLPRPDVIFCSSPPLPQVVTCAVLARLWNVPWALEVRDLWPAFVIEGGLLPEGPIAQAMRAIEAFAYRSAGAVISVSPGFVPYLEAMGCRDVVTAPSGGDPMLMDADRSIGAEWRKAHCIEGPMVLYAGSFNAAYGIPKLLKAARASGATWVFAGNGEDGALVEAAGVYYLGSLPRTQLLPAFLAADVGINSHAPWPLLDTTITGKLFDYMAAGVPVVSLRDGQMGEIIRAAGCGVVTDDLVAGVETMQGRPDAGQAGRNWIRAHMHADAMARRTAEAILGAERKGAIRHLPGALSDVMFGRVTGAIASTFCPDRQATIRRAFDGWPTCGAGSPLSTPAILI
jgi:glycosyltransferase involved in cell wall biosynthesis